MAYGLVNQWQGLLTSGWTSLKCVVIGTLLIEVDWSGFNSTKEAYFIV